MGNERIINEELIFTAAMEIQDPEQRLAYLQETCREDKALQARVEALLAVYENDTSVVERAASSLQLTLEASGQVERPGATIDRYKLLERIGEGGMAVVYMAEQQYPIRRRVALKIIKLGMDTKNVVARFEAERQALALMDHPNIAKVFDGGATDTGRPYFVMELVRGVSITEYCDSNRLNTRERLELFVQVCNAVQHAHQKGIIHRDIKPSNVMVTLHDGKPVPKVIDFGIAKATSQRLTEQTLFTRYAQMIGTPEYMSPEQAEMSGLDVDTRTDIYSLGVLLYQLLTGATPFEAQTLREAGYTEMQRIIRETDPLKPSTKIRTLGQTITGVAQCRRTSPEMLRKLVKGDLDWIVMKTLEKDRTRRYETAHTLAEDIERHLRHEPITAGSPGAVYRVRKFVRRHRTHLVIGSATAIVLAGLLFAVVTYARFSIQRTRGNHERGLVLVEDLLGRGEYASALTEIQPILSSRFVGARARLLHARILLELRDPRAGLEQLRELLKERAEIAANAHFLLAWMYLEAAPNDPPMKQKAESHLQQGEKLLPRTAEAYLLRAMTAQTVQETLACLNEALNLDPTHYGARRARALAYHALGEYRAMETEASTMIGSQPVNSAGYVLRAIARRELTLAGNNLTLLDEAMADHDQAARLIAPRDRRRAELCDQRRQTLMCMGRYGEALAEAETCLKLEPDRPTHRFNLFCILTALGQYERAQALYDEILALDETEQMHCEASTRRHVFDSLAAGQAWHPKDNPPPGPAFVAMHQADDEYHQLANKAIRIVAEGFHPTWSPNGAELAYSRGMLGASGIEIRNLKTRKTRLLTVPGKDPAWSPDGRLIAYVRDRQILSLTDLTSEPEGEHRPFEQEEVWIVQADGTDRPRFLAKGGWPNWSGDSRHVYYHSRAENKIYSIAVDSNRPDVQEVCLCADLFPVVSPDETRFAFMDGTPTFHIRDVSDGVDVASWPGPPEKTRLFFNWSPDGRAISVGSFWFGGLWVYDVYQQTASKLLDGSFGWCSWSPDMSRLAIERVYGQWHHEIWITDRPFGTPQQAPN